MALFVDKLTWLTSHLLTLQHQVKQPENCLVSMKYHLNRLKNMYNAGPEIDKMQWID